MVCCQVLPVPQLHGYHHTHLCGHKTAPLRGGATSDQGLQHQPGCAGGEQPRRRDRGIRGNFCAVRHFRSLPPALQIPGAVQEGVEHTPSRERCAVLDILNSGNGLPYIPKSLCTGPPSQIGPLHGPWIPPWRNPSVPLLLPRAAPEVPPTPSQAFNPGGPVVHRATTGNTQITFQGVTLEPVDTFGDLVGC